MVIPLEVHYTTIGKRKIRNVVVAIFPTVLVQAMKLRKVEPLYMIMGDIVVDWGVTSPGFNAFMENNYVNTKTS